MKAISDWLSANILAITVIQQGLFAALSAGCQIAGWQGASKIFGTCCTLDLGRILRFFAEKLEDARVRRLAKCCSLLCVLLSAGCAGTFEEAKLAGRQARQAAPSATASSPKRCQSLSERQYWFTGTGLTLVAAGAAVASLSLPATSPTVETILLVGGTGATVGGGGLVWLGNNAGVNYTREECGK